MVGGTAEERERERYSVGVIPCYIPEDPKLQQKLNHIFSLRSIKTVNEKKIICVQVTCFSSHKNLK
jgi:hypothetical protein